MKLISDLLTQGWTETDIQLKYGYSWNTIMKAKEEMARQASESQAVKLCKTTSLIYAHLYYSSIEFSLRNYGFDFFTIGDITNSVYLQLEILFTSGLFSLINSLFLGKRSFRRIFAVQ